MEGAPLRAKKGQRMEKRQFIGGLEVTDFPPTIKKGDIITIPNGGPSYKVLQTPAETNSHACRVRGADGKKYWQFPFVGILINGVPLTRGEDK